MPTNNYSDAHGYQKDVDPTRWSSPVASGPPPAETEQTEDGMVRATTADPYTDDNDAVVRNFGNS